MKITKTDWNGNEIEFESYYDCISCATTPTIAWSDEFLKNYTAYNAAQFVRLFFDAGLPVRVAITFILSGLNLRIGDTTEQQRNILKNINREIGEICDANC